MRRDEQARPVSIAAKHAVHISFRVLSHIGQAALLQFCHVKTSPFRLLKWRRLHLVDRNLFGNRIGMIRRQKLYPGFYRCVS